MNMFVKNYNTLLTISIESPLWVDVIVKKNINCNLNKHSDSIVIFASVL